MCIKQGYTQQDAQEFLCELLDKIVNELEHNHVKRSVAESRLALKVLDVSCICVKQARYVNKPHIMY